jgi:hypothetical protein
LHIPLTAWASLLGTKSGLLTSTTSRLCYQLVLNLIYAGSFVVIFLVIKCLGHFISTVCRARDGRRSYDHSAAHGQGSF